MSVSDEQAENTQKKDGYGEMTTAWLDAGPQVAQYEAGLAAEKKRMWMAIGGAVFLVVLVVAVLAII